MRRARDRARRAAQTAEERDARLRQIRENRRQSLATESEEERAVRLQQMSANQCHRLATETEEERAARLQQMSANQCHRLTTETEEERAARSSHPSIQLSTPSIHPCRPVPVAVLKIIDLILPSSCPSHIHPPLQASPSGCAEDHLILPSSCPSHPSCNPSTMLHTYFLLGMIVHVCTHRSRPHPCTQPRKTG